MLNEKALSLILQQFGEAVGVFDAKSGELVFSNDSFKFCFPVADEAALRFDQVFPAEQTGNVGEVKVRDRMQKRLVLRLEKSQLTLPEGEFQLVRATDLTALRKQESLFAAASQTVEINRQAAINSRANLRALLNSLPQAFLVMGHSLKVLPESSNNVREMFNLAAETEIEGLEVLNLLNLSDEFREMVQFFFTGGDLEVLEPLLPKEIELHGRSLALRYLPFKGETAESKLIVAVEDVTELKRLSKQVDSQNRMALSMYRILEFKSDFHELLDLLDESTTLLDDEILFKRRVHDLKGGFAFLECPALVEICHEFELIWKSEGYSRANGVEFVAKIQAEVTSITSHLRNVFNIEEEKSSLKIKKSDFEQLEEEMQHLGLPSDVVERYSDLANVSLSECFKPLVRVWDQSLNKVGKTGNPIHMTGDALVRKSEIKYLLKSFVHIVRNAADHGIEPAEVRKARGKPEQGNFWINVRNTAGEIEIEFRDDGGGLDESALIATCVEKGLIPDARPFAKSYASADL